MLELETVVRDFYSLVRAGDSATLSAIFEGEPFLDTPLQGAIKGTAAFTDFVQTQAQWLTERQAQTELVALVDTSARLVAEFTLKLRQAERVIELPVAAVFERSGNRVTAVRVYHSTWPLTGSHILRAPLLPVAAELEEPQVVQQYTLGLMTANLDILRPLFEDAAYVREPSGAPYIHQGREGREAMYKMGLALGGVVLKHCTATVTSRYCAAEYVCDRWGDTDLPPQAGIVVYEFGDNGLLRAVRIYDDVTPPGE